MGIVVSIFVAVFLIYVGIKITSYIFNKGKESFDDSVIGMSLKLKKEKLRQELDKIEQTRKKPAISPEYVDYLKNLKDTKEFYTDNSFFLKGRCILGTSIIVDL